MLVGAACADRRVAADTGLMYALLNHADAEAKLAELPVVGDVTAELGLCYLVLAAGLVQGLMGTKTNWARKAYVSATAPSGGPPRSLSCRPQDVPWPHTVAPEKNKDKLRFDAVQRAHLNFVENYPQFLGVAFFALKIAPKLATVCGTLFLLGRFAPYAPLAADTALAVPAHLPTPPGSYLRWATTLASRRKRTMGRSGTCSASSPCTACAGCGS